MKKQDTKSMTFAFPPYILMIIREVLNSDLKLRMEDAKSGVVRWIDNMFGYRLQVSMADPVEKEEFVRHVNGGNFVYNSKAGWT